jgi:hypothetical protein
MRRSIFLALSVIFSLTGILQANPADIYPTGKVDMIDFAVFAAAWLSDDSPTANWNPDCDISEPNDGFIDELDLAVLAANWLWTALDDKVWVDINDPGVSGHEAFNGYMSKYETTNAQYCAYLNAANASEAITISVDRVMGASGPYLGHMYYRLTGSGHTYNGATDGGAARINWTGSSFTVDSGFGNHPVTYVSWRGSMAFCNYYGWRLPTEWEWQAVADHTVDDPYTYGCGPNINNSIANYYDSTHPYGTTAVGAFGAYGYGMCDMAGNVFEWTDSIYSSSNHVTRGGSWDVTDQYSAVLHRNGNSGTLHYVGFRVCH